MAQRVYKIDENSLAAYMAHNKRSSVIVGETEDGFIVQNGKKVHQIPKGDVENFALDNGFVEGMGYDALPEHKKDIAKASRMKDTAYKQEQEAYKNSLKEENLQGYHNQLRSTRLSNAIDAETMQNIKNEQGPIKGVHYKGNMKYPKGGGTNQ